MGRRLGIGGAAPAAAGIVLALSTAARAEIRYDVRQVTLAVDASIAFTGAVAKDPVSSAAPLASGKLDGYGSASLEWVANGGVVAGAFLSGDTADRRPDTLKNNRAFAYLSGVDGRLEVGATSGPARRMSFYAPVLGLGQVRGEFTRFAGVGALLWPYDTRQSAKVAYFSPPIQGWRMGVSWAPRVERFSVIHRNAVELGTQYETPAGSWVLGASAAYVFAAADRPGLADIRSWSVGFQARRDHLVIGGAYVDRGDSGLYAKGINQHEANIGFAWRQSRWSLAASAASTVAAGFTNRLAAIGVSRSINDQVELTADLVDVRESGGQLPARNGAVMLVGIELSL